MSQKKPSLKINSNKNNRKKTYKFSPIGNNSKKLNSNSNKKIFDFNKYIAKDDIDDTYNDIIPENDSIVYFLILSHGSVNFINNNYDSDDDDNDDSDDADDADDADADDAEYINVSNNLEYFNKITYAPFGFANYGTDDKYMLDSITTKINEFIDKNNSPLVNNKLIASLRQVDCVLEMQKEILENLKNASTVSDLFHKCGLKILSDREQTLYGSVLYLKDKNRKIDYQDEEITTQIINKKFSIGEKDSEHMNIYVVFAKGGKLNTGDKVLNSDKYFEYLVNLKIEKRKEYWDEWLEKYPRRIKDYNEEMIKITNEAYEQTKKKNFNEITTQELLKFAEHYGYKNVIMIDYSCDVCINDCGKTVSRNKVMAIRDCFHQFHGRGIDKKLKKTKKHISRKLKKNRKSKKYKKM